MPLQIQALTKAVQSNVVLLPQATTGSIFVVAGDVQVLCVQGVVTTTIGAVANATKLQAVCGALTAVDLCATADVNALAAGSIFNMVNGFGTGAVITAANGVVIQGSVLVTAPTAFLMMCGTTGAGVIRVNCAGSSGAGAAGGAFRWTCLYVPLSNGASIVSA